MNKIQALRRSLSLLLALLILLMLLSSCVKPKEKSNDPEAILERMTLEQKLGQMMLVSFRGWKDSGNDDDPTVNVTELNDELRAALSEDFYGGMLLFAENCRDAEQTARLVADMQATNQAAGGVPLLVCTDQEGGGVARLGFGTTGPGNMALSASGNPNNAAAMAAVYGEELALLGIHADFAPVEDVNNNPNNPVIGIRSFSDMPEVTAVYGAAYIKGLHSTGTMATLKHFPGHGNTDTDSHTGFPLVDSSYEELSAQELISFQLGIDGGADMVMTAHIQYPQIETQTYTSTSTGEPVYLPATMSKTILTDILRGELGFEGVVVSDALDMGAISDNFSEEDVLRLTINAGVDLLILPGVWNSDQLQKTRDTVKLAAQLVEDGKIDIERVNDAVLRILKLKQKYGLLDKTDFTLTDEQVSAAVEGVGSAEHRQTAFDIAQKAVTVLKNENDAFPVELRSGESALILFADSCASRVATGDLAIQLLQEQNALPRDAEVTVMVNTGENGEECVEAALTADAVVLVNRVYAAACLDPNTGDGFSTAVFDEIIAERHAEGKPVIVVSCQLPYDAGRFPDADALVLTYGSAVMRALPPESGEGSAYVPNLAAGLCACFGLGEAAGRLPVDLPTLDEDYKLTETIFCHAGEKMEAAGTELYAAQPRENPSPDWVTALPQAQDPSVTQLFVVAGMGMDKTTATVSMHQRDENGEWRQILSTPGFVGRNGLCPDEEHKEGCGQTPIGVYSFNAALGIAEDPGCAIPYTQVTEDIYWSGDMREGMHYNEMVSILDYPDLDLDNSERIVDYEYQYQYCLNISFNAEGTPGRGSAIFLHCIGPQKPYTGGCVAIPEYSMLQVMQRVQPECVVVIDTLENLGGSL